MREHDSALPEVDITLSKQRRAANDETVSPGGQSAGAPPPFIRHCLSSGLRIFKSVDHSTANPRWIVTARTAAGNAKCFAD